jgi:2-hydroxy-3-oxopropionate reductase
MTRTGNTAAVIGLEVMGGPMAADLINAGYDVGGFNRSAGKVETHVARGGRGASSIAEAVEGADVVWTVLHMLIETLSRRRPA